MNERLQSYGDVRFVQFPHPGKEHDVGSDGIRCWGRGDRLHRRTFLQSPAHYRTTLEGPDEQGDVAFWGEWEGDARLVAELDPAHEGPRFLCAANPSAEAPIIADGTPPQNTDPFVWGDTIAYVGCRQPTNRKLRQLGRGSLILFGSSLDNRFVLDTVLVVAGWTDHDCDTYADSLDGIASEDHLRIGLAPFHGWGAAGTLRYYAGATPADPVAGMYSFVPCRSADGSKSGFARPTIAIEPVIKPNLRMQARASEPMAVDAVAGLWCEVVRQVLDQGLALATRLDLERT